MKKDLSAVDETFHGAAPHHLSAKLNAESFDEWKRWFANNCSEWNTVEDIEAELGRKVAE